MRPIIKSIKETQLPMGCTAEPLGDDVLYTAPDRKQFLKTKNGIFPYGSEHWKYNDSIGKHCQCCWCSTFAASKKYGH